MAHDWNVSPKEAVRIQQEMRSKVRIEDDFGTLRSVAGVDVGFRKENNTGRAAIAVLDFPGLHLKERVTAEAELKFPYVPGLLSFREIPLILEAIDKLQAPPDLFICDGQGIAHPRRFGVACHLGVLTGIPAIGAAKSRLTGTFGKVPAAKGAWAPLMDNEETIGAVLRTREKVKPIFVSPGHKVNLETAISLVMQCVTRYKLPETTRQAHSISLFRS